MATLGRGGWPEGKELRLREPTGLFPSANSASWRQLSTAQLSVVVLAQADGNGGGDVLRFVLPLVILGGLFYVLLVLPQRRRARAHEALQSSVEVGDEIRTIGGIYGRVKSISDKDVEIDVGAGTVMRVSKRAIADKIGESEE